MNEHDGHEMLVARCKALEAIALKYMELHNLETGTTYFTEKELKMFLEKEVERLEPGCQHQVR